MSATKDMHTPINHLVLPTMNNTVSQDNDKKSIKIAYRHHRTSNDCMGFMLLPGLGGDMHGRKGTNILRYCLKHDLNCLLFDYSGLGLSEGKFHERNMTDWYNEALHLLCQMTNKHTVLIASSMGAWIALRLLLNQNSNLTDAAQQHTNIVGLILLCPALNFTKEMTENLTTEERHQLKQFGYMNHEGIMITENLLTDGNRHLITKSQLHSIQSPVTIIHGCDDVSVDYVDSVQLFHDLSNSGNCTLRLLPNADHRMHDPLSMSGLRRAMKQMTEHFQC